jgi:hypothetical protein
VSIGYSAAVGEVDGIGGSGNPTLVAFSDEIGTSGTYFATGSALLNIASGDGGYCYLTSFDEGGGGTQGGSSNGGNYQQASMTNTIFASAGDFIVMYCYSAANTGNTNVFDASLTAVLIDSSDDSKKANRKTHSSHTLGAPVDLDLKKRK